MAKPATENSALAIHMRAQHRERPDRWKEYDDYGWQERWHLKIHEVVEREPNNLLVQSFINVDHSHTVDEYLKFMKDGISDPV